MTEVITWKSRASLNCVRYTHCRLGFLIILADIWPYANKFTAYRSSTDVAAIVSHCRLLLFMRSDDSSYLLDQLFIFTFICRISYIRFFGFPSLIILFDSVR